MSVKRRRTVVQLGAAVVVAVGLAMSGAPGTGAAAGVGSVPAAHDCPPSWPTCGTDPRLSQITVVTAGRGSMQAAYDCPPEWPTCGPEPHLWSTNSW